MNMEDEELSNSGGVRTQSLAVGDHCATSYVSSACEELGTSKSKFS